MSFVSSGKSKKFHTNNICKFISIIITIIFLKELLLLLLLLSFVRVY